jgi:hypothetical protein
MKLRPGHSSAYGSTDAALVVQLELLHPLLNPTMAVLSLMAEKVGLFVQLGLVRIVQGSPRSRRFPAGLADCLAAEAAALQPGPYLSSCV